MAIGTALGWSDGAVAFVFGSAVLVGEAISGGDEPEHGGSHTSAALTGWL